MDFITNQGVQAAVEAGPGDLKINQGLRSRDHRDGRDQVHANVFILRLEMRVVVQFRRSADAELHGNRHKYHNEWILDLRVKGVADGRVTWIATTAIYGLVDVS